MQINNSIGNYQIKQNIQTLNYQNQTQYLNQPIIHFSQVIHLWKYHQKSINQFIGLTVKLKSINKSTPIKETKYNKRQHSKYSTQQNYNHQTILLFNTYTKSKSKLSNSTIDIKLPIDNYLNALNNLQTTKNKLLFILINTNQNLLSSQIQPQHIQSLHEQRNIIIQKILNINTVTQLIDSLNTIKSLLTYLLQKCAIQHQKSTNFQSISDLLNYFLTNILQLKTCISYRIQIFNSKTQYPANIPFSSSQKPKNTQFASVIQNHQGPQQTSVNKLIGRKVFKILPFKPPN